MIQKLLTNETTSDGRRRDWRGPVRRPYAVVPLHPVQRPRWRPDAPILSEADEWLIVPKAAWRSGSCAWRTT
jgi:hypothetical protein